jgi:PST family polysaccharide transporter
LFSLSAIRGALIAVGLCLAAPVAASFYNDPRVFWVFVGVSAYPLLTGLINPRFYEFERLLDYSKEFFAAVANKIAGVAVSIVIAVTFRSYWAIILGLATNGLVQLVLSYLMRPYRPRISFVSLKRVLGFSGWLTGVGLMSALNNKLDPLVLARAIGVGGAGQYFMGLQLAELPTREIAFPVTRAIYPGLSELQGDPVRANRAFLKGVEAMAAIAMPAGIGFALVARDLVPLLIGDKWIDAIAVVQIITPVMSVQMPLLATQYYAMAVGSTRLVFLRELIFFFIRTPVFIVSAIHFGLLGAAWAVAACGLIHILLNLALYSRTSGDNWIRPIWRARRSALSVAAMSAVLTGLHAAGWMEGAPALFKVAAESSLGACIYFLSHGLLWRLENRPDGVERMMIDLCVPVARRLVNRLI